MVLPYIVSGVSTSQVEVDKQDKDDRHGDGVSAKSRVSRTVSRENGHQHTSIALHVSSARSEKNESRAAMSRLSGSCSCTCENFNGEDGGAVLRALAGVNLVTLPSNF